LVLQAALQPAGAGCGVRVGFTASRKVGNAVVRNRAKRRLRAVAAQVLSNQDKSGMDYVLIARAATAKRPFAALLADLEVAMHRVQPSVRSPRPQAAEQE
jgi:ribonuclease P protein component